MPGQNTDEHMIMDDAHQQPLYSDSSGQTIPLKQMPTHAIASFSTEFTSDWYQQAEQSIRWSSESFNTTFGML